MKRFRLFVLSLYVLALNWVMKAVEKAIMRTEPAFRRLYREVR